MAQTGSKQLKSIVDFCFCPSNERFLLVLVLDESLSCEDITEKEQVMVQLFDLNELIENKEVAEPVSSLSSQLETEMKQIEAMMA